MKLLSKFKQSARKALVFGAVTAAVVSAGIFGTTLVKAAGAVDCDANAVVTGGVSSRGDVQKAMKKGATCSVNHTTYHNSPKQVNAVFSYSQFGISQDDVKNLDVTVGSVSKSGNVYAHGTNDLVATDAITAGRQWVTGCTPSTCKHVTNDGVSFYTRKPAVSFRQESLSALVFTKNGVFQFAVLESCGNPVHAKPQNPDYKINKLVSVKGKSDFHNQITVKPGTHVVYKIVVESTGRVAVKNVLVKDDLNKHIDYVANSLTRDGKEVTADKKFFDDGVTIDKLKPGDKVVFKFEAIIGKGDTVENCKPENMLPNLAAINAPSLPKKDDKAFVNKKCLPKPEFACTDLNMVNQISRKTFRFKATASAKNATINGYVFDFGDGTSKSVSTHAGAAKVKHTYNSAGTYHISVGVQIKGVKDLVTSNKCKVTVTVKPAPAAECTDLVLTSAPNTRSVTATVSYETSNGAKLKNIVYRFDGVATSATTATTVNHTFTQDGTHTVSATLTFTAPEGTNAPDPSVCSDQITITSAAPTCDAFDFTVDNANRTITVSRYDISENGAEFADAIIDWGDATDGNIDVTLVTDKNQVVGQTHSFSDDLGNGPFTVRVVTDFLVNDELVTVISPNCQKPVSFTVTPPTETPPPPTPPTTLVNTGAGSVIGLFSLVTVAGAIAHRWFLARRLGS